MGLRVATYQEAGTRDTGLFFRAWQCLTATAACSLGLLSALLPCGSVYILCLVHDAQLNGVQTLQSPQAEMWGALAFCHFSLLTLEASDLFLQEYFPSVLPACPQQIPDGCKSPDEGAISLVLFLLDRLEQTLYIAGEVLCFQCFGL